MNSKSFLGSLFLCSVLLFSTVSCNKEEEQPEIKVVVTTLSAQPNLMSALVKMQISAPGLSLSSLDEFGVFYSQNSKVTVKDRKVRASVQNGDTISVKIPNLSPNTTYYFKAYAIRNGVMESGSTKSFQTLSSANIIVTGTFDKDTRHATATLNCQGFEDEITEAGFCYTYKSDVDPNVDSDSKVYDSLCTSGNLDLEILDVPFEKIYYRSYVKVNGFAVYGETRSGEGNHMIATGDIDTDTYSMTGSLDFIMGYTKLRTGICYSKTNQQPTISDKKTYNSKLDTLNVSFVASFPQIPFGTVYCRPFAQIGSQVVYGDAKSFFHQMIPGNPVDLGLSVLWADMNVGADSPKGNGLYYDWGGVEDKDNYSETTMSFVETHPDYPGSLFIQKYNTREDYMIPGSEADHRTVLLPEDDAAAHQWGGNWRTPSVEEFQELIDSCKIDWVREDMCFKFTGPNGNYIILPGSGYAGGYEFYQNRSYAYYQTRSLHSKYDEACWALYISSNVNVIVTTETVQTSGNCTYDFLADGRWYGRTVRPVCPRN